LQNHNTSPNTPEFLANFRRLISKNIVRKDLSPGEYSLASHNRSLQHLHNFQGHHPLA